MEHLHPRISELEQSSVSIPTLPIISQLIIALHKFTEAEKVDFIAIHQFLSCNSDLPIHFGKRDETLLRYSFAKLIKTIIISPVQTKEKALCLEVCVNIAMVGKLNFGQEDWTVIISQLSKIALAEKDCLLYFITRLEGMQRTQSQFSTRLDAVPALLQLLKDCPRWAHLDAAFLIQAFVETSLLSVVSSNKKVVIAQIHWLPTLIFDIMHSCDEIIESLIYDIYPYDDPYNIIEMVSKIVAEYDYDEKKKGSIKVNALGSIGIPMLVKLHIGLDYQIGMTEMKKLDFEKWCLNGKRQNVSHAVADAWCQFASQFNFFSMFDNKVHSTLSRESMNQHNITSKEASYLLSLFHYVIQAHLDITKPSFNDQWLIPIDKLLQISLKTQHKGLCQYILHTNLAKQLFLGVNMCDKNAFKLTKTLSYLWIGCPQKFCLLLDEILIQKTDNRIEFQCDIKFLILATSFYKKFKEDERDNQLQPPELVDAVNRVFDETLLKDPPFLFLQTHLSQPSLAATTLLIGLALATPVKPIYSTWVTYVNRDQIVSNEIQAILNLKVDKSIYERFKRWIHHHDENGYDDAELFGMEYGNLRVMVKELMEIFEN